MANKGVVFVSSDWISDLLNEALDDFDAEIIRGPASGAPGMMVYDKADYADLFGRADIIIASPLAQINRAILEAAPRLRAVMSPVIGVESIDVDAASELGIMVGHGATPENFIGMAEASVMLIAAMVLELPIKQKLLRDNAPRPRQMSARLVRGKTIGLIGMGRIARAVVERMQGWGVHFLAFDPYVTQDQAPAGVTMVDLTTLLTGSDVVSVHVTVTGETRHMLGEAELQQMRRDAFLVNTARGAAIDEAALYRVLKEGGIAGAALDVFEQEPLPADSPLRTLDNVILTPHMIGHTKDVMDSLPVAARENVRRVFNGEPPLYTKNPDVLPRWRDRLATLN